MAQNFVACDREQELLLPPSLREWLPEGHLAWFVLDAVAAFDLSEVFAAYRIDGYAHASRNRSRTRPIARSAPPSARPPTCRPPGRAALPG
jgi:hypothetical protein